MTSILISLVLALVTFVQIPFQDGHLLAHLLAVFLCSLEDPMLHTLSEEHGHCASSFFASSIACFFRRASPSSRESHGSQQRLKRTGYTLRLWSFSFSFKRSSFASSALAARCSPLQTCSERASRSTAEATACSASSLQGPVPHLRQPPLLWRQPGISRLLAPLKRDQSPTI